MTCRTCKANKVCDHNKYGFENCNNYIPDKADFVEIVRCGKCKHGDVSIISKTTDGQEDIACYCKLKKVVTDIDSYCPSGERK